MSDPHKLHRFLDAQEPVFDQVLRELSAGRKQTHWMWFIFPQLGGLGHSPTAQHFAIASREEAKAYLRHPILGPRLETCCQIVNALQNRSAERIFGYPDYLKFRSCLTLFAEAAPDNPAFREGLQKYFGGQPDALTLKLTNS